VAQDFLPALRDELARLDPVTTRLARAFAQAGHQLYLVGGPVRDAVLGLECADLDFTTGARPDQIEAILAGLGGPLWDVGRQFGTIGTRLRAGGQEWQVEITTFRSDAYHLDSRKPEVRFGDSIDQDLVRRDFTINAMAIDLADGSFVDPFRGVVDLAQRALRTPATAEMSFSDDPLRMVRAARFAARFGLRPAPEVIRAMMAMTDRLRIVSAERIRDEWSKLLLTDRPRVGVDILVRTGLAEVCLPELPALRLQVDEHHHHKDVYEHSLTVLDQAIVLEKARHHTPDLVLRLAALLHDIGKPTTRRLEADGEVSFWGHDVVGARLAHQRLMALRFPKEVVESVSQLVELHLRFHGYATQSQWSDAAVRRYVRDAGDELERLHILTRSDCTTRNQAKAELLRRAYDELEWRIDELRAQEELDALRPDLDGNQIMAILGIKPSRTVGEAYAYLLERRLERGPASQEQATAELLSWWQARQA
jgi:poly(A) polymerase